MSTLYDTYRKKVIGELKKAHGFTSDLRVPRIIKVVVNTGVGRIREEKERDEIRSILTMITGQRPDERPARTAIASFKSRKGLVIGYRATLRRRRMYDFLDRLVLSAIPRMRDFRGIELSAVDDAGNLNIGVREHIIFPEVIGEDVKRIYGFQVTVVTKAKSREEAIELYRAMGFPLARGESDS